MDDFYDDEYDLPEKGCLPILIIAFGAAMLVAGIFIGWAVFG